VFTIWTHICGVNNFYAICEMRISDEKAVTQGIKMIRSSRLVKVASPCLLDITSNSQGYFAFHTKIHKSAVSRLYSQNRRSDIFYSSLIAINLKLMVHLLDPLTYKSLFNKSVIQLNFLYVTSAYLDYSYKNIFTRSFILSYIIMCRFGFLKLISVLFN